MGSTSTSTSSSTSSSMKLIHFLLLFCLLFLPLASASSSVTDGIRSDNNNNNNNNIVNVVNVVKEEDVVNAIQLLESLGVPLENFCTTSSSDVDYSSSSSSSSSLVVLPICGGTTSNTSSRHHDHQEDVKETAFLLRRHLQEEGEELLTVEEALPVDEEEASNDDEEEEPSFEDDPWFYITHGLCAAMCVLVAALAAGLTMGLLSLDPLMLLIKMRAGATEKERKQAEQLLPIVKQHHLLLVTLLLLNSMANEALPLFLEVLVSPVVAVILSVTLVLFFGEIIPSAVFTGPNKIELASKMVPLVKLVMCLLWPISFPIAKMLDRLLHDGDDEGSGVGDVFNRGELSALVRIQYEERLAAKQERKKQREAFRQQAVDLQRVSYRLNEALRKSKRDFVKEQLSMQDSGITPSVTTAPFPPNNNNNSLNTTTTTLTNPIAPTFHNERTPSIHLDEVSMVEGALQMKTKVAMDVYTPIHKMFSVSHDMILNERNVVSIYSSGYSRIPVYVPNPDRPKSKTAICGILKTKQLIVVNPNGNRPLQTLPFYTPLCVSPKMNLVDLLNHFQTGRVGHLALVCARPHLGQDSLNEGRPLPDGAGLMGVITLEDILEALLQEQIYDETDKVEREEVRLARWASKKWKRFVENNKRKRAMEGQDKVVSIGTIVDRAMDAAHDQQPQTGGEGTPLLGSGGSSSNSQQGSGGSGGLLGFLDGVFNNN